MKKKNARARDVEVRIHCEVVRRIRQHARSSTKAEICGVLIGSERDGITLIEAGIPGNDAVEAGTHVTFTQDTWEYIYRVKDCDFPDARIVGWYHSHPGFGVFLSDHDTFIHKNFFSAPGQVAWVYDPHSDEEGCFGWVEDRLERLPRIIFCDDKGGEGAGETGKPEPLFLAQAEEGPAVPAAAPRAKSELMSMALTMLIYTIVFGAGILATSYYFFSHFLLVPVDPRTGQPMIVARPDSGGDFGKPNGADSAAPLTTPSPLTTPPSAKGNP